MLSAILFGVATPIAKLLLADTQPLIIAGLLYVGSGLGLTVLILVRSRGRFALGIDGSDRPWLAAAVACGGIVAPALLMFGLAHADTAAASLLLNLEAVFTAIIAWIVFKEATSRRILIGFVSICVGSVVLIWPSNLSSSQDPMALSAIAAACLCWGIDNNLTRKISAGDARAIAAVKGLVAGVTNVALAFILQAKLPAGGKVVASMVLGFVGYGMSLVLFIYSLRHLGTARTGAYFATAPFIGSFVAIILFGQAVDWPFWVAAAFMVVGVWLHLTEHHDHEHTHERLVHTHSHEHDAHHQHQHPVGWNGEEPHLHEHTHEPLRHRHPHFPDIHHQHSHG